MGHLLPDVLHDAQLERQNDFSIPWNVCLSPSLLTHQYRDANKVLENKGAVLELMVQSEQKKENPMAQGPPGGTSMDLRMRAV